VEALGDPVEKGQVIARIYDMTRSGKPPVEYHAERSGILAARRFPALVHMGDTIAVIAEVVDSLG
jgi:N-alpha-acetyl-L-2,4-diaminobutyrate deacetylase